MSNLALLLCRQGKYTEAKAIQQQTLQLQKTVLGKDHPDTLMSMNNLASIQRPRRCSSRLYSWNKICHL